MENLDKSSRSIFVGNIPYDTSEEKLSELFAQAGPVISFRLVYDRDSGKSKGYGFCEYNSVAVAASAIRNLKDIDINGRILRIGSAVGEQNAMEVAINNNIDFMKHPTESPYGDRVDPHQVGPSINQAILSIPPEQLYNLMTEMKQFIQNNPREASKLLLENPQLTYALMKAQISMKIIEPTVAISMMSQTNDYNPNINNANVTINQSLLPPNIFQNQNMLISNNNQQMFMNNNVGQQMYINNNNISQMNVPNMFQPTGMPLTYVPFFHEHVPDRPRNNIEVHTLVNNVYPMSNINQEQFSTHQGISLNGIKRENFGCNNSQR